MLKAARQLDIKVPEQLAVIGFDDLDMAEYADLTTISQHLDESGRLAVEILLAQIEAAFQTSKACQTSFNINRASNCVKMDIDSTVKKLYNLYESAFKISLTQSLICIL